MPGLPAWLESYRSLPRRVYVFAAGQFLINLIHGAQFLLTRQAFQTQREATEKWRRVQLSSVQLTSYFSGYSEIMDLREQRKQALGNKFVLKDFHEQFLSYGSAPVKVIKELMN